MPKKFDEDLDQRRNRDDDLKIPSEPGKPPRPATEPAGSEKSASSTKTATDPVTGAPNPKR